MRDESTEIGGRGSGFATTRWSVVLAARGQNRRAGLDVLVRLYWKPVYTCIRRKWRRSNEDAKDLTQAFFADLLGRPTLERADAARGRFRTYLRACLDGFLAKAHEAETAAKRGGGAKARDFIVAESVADDGTPEAAFEKDWKETVLREAVERMKAECAKEGREGWFAVFEAMHLRAKPASYAELAKKLGVPETTVTNHLSRARARYRAHVKAIVRDSVATEEDFRVEMKSVFGEES
jgi:RNA polymerase sigma-70 factor (ECF subfamily)